MQQEEQVLILVKVLLTRADLACRFHSSGMFVTIEESVLMDTHQRLTFENIHGFHWVAQLLLRPLRFM